MCERVLGFRQAQDNNKVQTFQTKQSCHCIDVGSQRKNHEVTLVRNKHILLRERYREGEIPHQAKTGSGPILLTFSFLNVRDWLNEHPFCNMPEARLICNLVNGAQIKPGVLWTMLNLKSRISKLIKSDSIADESEKKRLRVLLTTSWWFSHIACAKAW